MLDIGTKVEIIDGMVLTPSAWGLRDAKGTVVAHEHNDAGSFNVVHLLNGYAGFGVDLTEGPMPGTQRDQGMAVPGWLALDDELEVIE